MSQDQLARMVGRGGRSAIGVHGFQVGGFIVEGGKTDKNAVSPLVARLNFPDDWHFLLITDDSKGRHGAAEREAFETLAPISSSLTATLCRLTLLGMLPSIAERNFQAFTESLAEFGRRVGACFAAQQGGIFTSPLADSVLDALARYGMRGVAQSSWGPTLAAVCDSRFRAEWLAARLSDILPASTQIICAPPNNLGARIEVLRNGYEGNSA
jgi:beta-RFAP synthase